jgi:hypothetical protein
MLHKPTCCELARDVVKWRLHDSIRGPIEDGWSIVAHTIVGSPQYVNISFCPFCGRHLVKQVLDLSV